MKRDRQTDGRTDRRTDRDRQTETDRGIETKSETAIAERQRVGGGGGIRARHRDREERQREITDGQTDRQGQRGGGDILREHKVVENILRQGKKPTNLPVRFSQEASG